MEIFKDLSTFQLSAVLIVGLLCFATALNWFFSIVKPENATFRKVKTIISSWWFISSFFLLALSLPKWGMIIALYCITLLATNEYLKVSKVKYKSYLRYMFFVMTTLQYLAIAFDNLFIFLSIIPLLCLLLIPGLIIYRATIEDLETVLSVSLGISLVIYYLSHLPALTSFSNLKLSSDQAALAVLILIFITWSNDIFQFITGKTFGGIKLVPQVSPNKTLSGFIGGLIGSIFLSILLAQTSLGFSLIQSVALGLVIGVTGIFGDLIFSSIKRHIGIKDFSNVLPGHGGYLDRLDSLIFTTPFYFHLLLFVAS